jgi:hypothetical protein
MLALNRSLWFTIQYDFSLVAKEMSDVAEIRDKLNEKAKKKAIEELQA